MGDSPAVGVSCYSADGQLMAVMRKSLAVLQ